MRTRAVSQLIAAALGTAVAVHGSAAGAETWAIDELGRRMRVEFDPGSQLRLGVASGVVLDNGQRRLAETIESGMAYRSQRVFGKPGESIRWQFDHRFVWGQVTPNLRGSGGVPVMDAAVYRMTWLRHADQSFLMLPTEPPRRMPFPFDIGADAEIGRLRSAQQGSGPDILRLGVAHSAIVLDPWRAARPGRSLELGIGVRYDLDLVGNPALESPRTIHRLSPFTAPTVRWRWQDQPGRVVAEIGAGWYPGWTSERRWDARGMEARGRLERVLIAFNDEPVSLVMDAAYARHPIIRGVEPRDELRVTAGLTMGMQLK